MQSKQIIIAVAVVIVLIGGYLIYSKSGTEDVKLAPPTETGAGVESGSITTNGKKMAFDAFLKQGGSYVCTVNQSVEGTESKGTVYVDGQNVSGQFNIVAQGMSMQSFFMTKDGYSYSWNSMMPSGFKVAVGQTANSDTGAGMSGSYSWNASQIGDYNCEPWTLDASKFTLPSTVTFTEVKK